MRDYQAAVAWFEDALRADPQSPELITRTFLMEASVGRFERAHSSPKVSSRSTRPMRWPSSSADRPDCRR